jgi:microcompartment protein CcmL/EutN
MEIKQAKEIVQQAIDRGVQKGIFTLVETKQIIDALIIINEMPEIESLEAPKAHQSNEEVVNAS